MCCFSGPVEEVAATRIFARMVAPGRQVLAYEMQLAAAAPVAMILPIPVPAASAEDAVRFISLEGYPELFTHLHAPFAPPVSAGPPSRGMSFLAPQTLQVHTVGAFVASFVPALADFARLDGQFRVPPGTIDRVPEYADWGFAVFQLAATKGATRVHPMAFEFPTRSPDRLFFPTVHVHDGALHATAEFAHRLYAQGVETIRPFATSTLPAGRHVQIRRTEGLVDGEAKLCMREMFGALPNLDTWAPLVAA